MGIFDFLKNNGEDSEGGSVMNFELLSFMREAFGKSIQRLSALSMGDYHVDFMLIDNDLLVTSGLSNYENRYGKFFELAIRVPYKWEQNNESVQHRWFVNIMQSIITEVVTGKEFIDDGFLKVYDRPFYYITELNSITLFKIASKTLQGGKTVTFLMVVPLYESELDDDYYKLDSSDLKGLAWQRASLTRANEYFETLDDYYPYDSDTQAMEDYLAIRDETLPGWNVDREPVGCRVSSNIVNSKNRIGYMYRSKPDGDFSGWYFLEVDSDFLYGNPDDLPIDFFAEMDSDLFTVAFLHPEIAKLLRALPGSVYVLQENGLYVPEK